MTDVPLREHMEARMKALEDRMQMTQAANRDALLAAKEANEYRLAALNELRLTVETMARTRASIGDVQNAQSLFYSEMKSLRAEFDSRMETMSGETKNLSRQVYIIVGGIAVLQFLYQYLIG